MSQELNIHFLCVSNEKVNQFMHKTYTPNYCSTHREKRVSALLLRFGLHFKSLAKELDTELPILAGVWLTAENLIQPKQNEKTIESFFLALNTRQIQFLKQHKYQDFGLECFNGQPPVLVAGWIDAYSSVSRGIAKQILSRLN